MGTANRATPEEAPLNQDVTPIIIEFLAAAESFGSHSENYGNSNHRLEDAAKDRQQSIHGNFSGRAVEFTRDHISMYYDWMVSHERTFKPGLIITHAGKDYYVPDITHDQFVDAFRHAAKEANGVVIVNLREIQLKNRSDESFVGRKLRAYDNTHFYV